MVQVIIVLIVLGVLIAFWKFFLFILIAGFVFWILKRNFASGKVQNTDEVKINMPSQENETFRSTYQPRREELKKNSNDFWIGSDQTITVAGYTISNGMLYVGKGLGSCRGYEIECALINPDLPINKKNDDYRVRRLDYWPSYSSASPEARSSYLKWLAAGKKDTEVDIGYVFLYFYGLERRLLHDCERSSNVQLEKDVLCAEIERLLSIYGINNSFYNYATSLLEFVRAEQNQYSKLYQEITPPVTNHAGCSLMLKMGLGQLSRDDMQIPSDWALAWYFSTPQPPVFTRTAAQRCKEEFKMLFSIEYEKAFGSGLKLKQNKTKLVIEHHPASRSLNEKTFINRLDLPDVTVLTNPIKKIAPIIQLCHERLDSYSRYLGRNPERVGTLDALLELPSTLWPEDVEKKIRSLQELVLNSNGQTVIKYSTFLEYLPDWKDKSRKRMNLFLEALDAHKLGMEPDIRFGGTMPEQDSHIILFLLPENQNKQTLSSQYAVASLAVYLAVIVSKADGEIAKEEVTMLSNQLGRWLDLELVEKSRIKAHLRWLIMQPLTMNGIKKRVEPIPQSDREMIGDLLFQIVHADNVVDVQEIKLLERIYRVLGLDVNTFYNKLHSVNLEPVTVVASQNSEQGYAIPKPQSVRVQDVPIVETSLDVRKIAILRSETERVTSILSAIFDQDETDANHDSAQEGAEFDNENNSQEMIASDLWGLPEPLSDFIRLLTKRTFWKLQELEEIASDRELMLGGALEQINEAAYDQFDDAFIEGDDVMEVNQKIVAVINQ